MDTDLHASFSKLDQYVRKENFSGYDPYDTLTSTWNFQKYGKWPPILAIQAQKRNPFSSRKLLGIEKGVNPKAIGLFLHSYSNLYQLEPTEELLETMQWLFAKLKEIRTKEYEEYCWGYNFDWASPVKFLKAYSPTIVASVFIAKGVYSYYQATHSEEAKNMLISIGDFIENHLDVTRDDTGICFSYSVEMKDCCYNATLLGTEHFARLYTITGEEKYKSLAQESVDFVVARQHEDGSWYYSLNHETGEERKQIDFHQGYILDSLHYFNELIGGKPKVVEAIKKGLEFYKKEQFLVTGQSLWRLPKKWPVDIHNQAQGIVTFSRLKTYDPKSLAFAHKIAEWTKANMQDADGHYYYKKYATHTVKTPMMRWSQAWMHLALTELNLAHNG